MRVGDLLPTLQMDVTQDRIDKYAVASGDFNPIHIEAAFGAASRFGGNIAHGMMVLAVVSEVMVEVFRTDWVVGGKLKVRFKAPVFPGDMVSANGKIKSIREDNGVREVVCSVEVSRQNGEVAIVGEASVPIGIDYCF